MASSKDIKQRIRSVRNTAQITKAMEVVSSTKMRRSQGIALSGRGYALAALDILKNVSVRIATRPALLLPRKIQNTLLLVLTSDKGLAGAFNSNVLRLYERWLNQSAKSGLVAPGGPSPLAIGRSDLHSKSDLGTSESKENIVIATVGKKARDYFSARVEKPMRAFTGFGDYISQKQTEPLADFLLEGYLKGECDRVILFYTNFRTTLKQEAKMVEVLPINVVKIEETIKGITPEHGRFAATTNNQQPTTYNYEYKFEPSASEVLEKLLPALFKIQVHHIVLESNASEHSARMVAMKNASENAKELMGELTIDYNKSRQAGITRELTEITAGKEAFEH